LHGIQRNRLNSKEEFIELMKLKAVKNEILDSPCTNIYVKLLFRNKYFFLNNFLTFFIILQAS